MIYLLVKIIWWPLWYNWHFASQDNLYNNYVIVLHRIIILPHKMPIMTIVILFHMTITTIMSLFGLCLQTGISLITATNNTLIYKINYKSRLKKVKRFVFFQATFYFKLMRCVTFKIVNTSLYLVYAGISLRDGWHSSIFSMINKFLRRKSQKTGYLKSISSIVVSYSHVVNYLMDNHYD